MVTVPTSAGDSEVADLGVVSVHEHVIVRSEVLQQHWPGFGHWDEASALAAARSRLARLKRAGVDAIVDTTVPGLGRDPALVSRAAVGTGVRVLFATGLFAPDGLPSPFWLRGPGRPLDGDDRRLEELFERDLTIGMGDTGIRAAVLSVLTGPAGMTDDAERLAGAVARVSARTGAVICAQAHAPTRRGIEQQEVLAGQGADLARVLIGGCSESTDLDYLEALIGAGSWLGWEGCGHSMEVSLDAQLDTLAELCWRGHAGRVLLSRDHVLVTDHWTDDEIASVLPGRQEASIRGKVLPGLRDRGVPDDVLRQILIRNPRDFLSRSRLAVPPAPAVPAPAARPRAVPAASAAARPAQVRGLAADRFVGREPEIAELRQLTARHRMVMLCGAGGIGKTRLLEALAGAVAADHPDGAVVVPLGDLCRPGLVAAEVAGQLGVCEEPGASPAETLSAALAGRRMLLALDCGDRVAGACAQLCARLLDRAPGLRIVAASREPLGVPGEAIWQVPPLRLPAAGQADPGLAGQADAVRLFTARAAAAAPGFALDRDSCPAVVALCRALGGVPLAIELAAARAWQLGTAHLASRLAARPGLAGPGDHPIPVPHGELTRAVTSWSHDLLERDEQLLLRRLSVFASWTLEMAEQVCADGQLPACLVAPLLAGLADAALVEPEPARHGHARYRLPGAVRDVAAARLAAAPEAAALRRRLRDYGAQRAEYLVSIAAARVPVTWPAVRKVFRDYDTDARSIRSALEWCLEHGDAETGLRICAGLRIFWTAGGAQDEGAQWLDAFLDTGALAVPAAVRGAALASRAQLAHGRGDLASAQSCAVAALELCRTAGDLSSASNALNALARVALAAGLPKEALQHAAEALELARDCGDQWMQVYALSHQSSALALLGRRDEAWTCQETALKIAVESGQHWSAALARLRLGDMVQVLDLDAAREYYLAALPFVREAMPGPDVARCLASLGRIALRQDDPCQARAYLSESLQLSLGAGSRGGVARVLLTFAELALREASPDRAVQLAAAATTQSGHAQLPPPSPDRIRRYREAAAGLGADEVARLWAAGLELTSLDAARLALEPPAARTAAVAL